MKLDETDSERMKKKVEQIKWANKRTNRTEYVQRICVWEMRIWFHEFSTRRSDFVFVSMTLALQMQIGKRVCVCLCVVRTQSIYIIVNEICKITIRQTQSFSFPQWIERMHQHFSKKKNVQIKPKPHNEIRNDSHIANDLAFKFMAWKSIIYIEEQFLQSWVWHSHIGCDVNRFVPNSEWLNEMPQDDSTVITRPTKNSLTLFFTWLCTFSHHLSPALSTRTLTVLYALRANIRVYKKKITCNEMQSACCVFVWFPIYA